MPASPTTARTPLVPSRAPSRSAAILRSSRCRPRSIRAILRRLEGGNPGGHLDSHRSEEHTSELQSQFHLVCRLLLEKKKKKKKKQRKTKKKQEKQKKIAKILK